MQEKRRFVALRNSMEELGAYVNTLIPAPTAEHKLGITLKRGFLDPKYL
jgi:hypothetical protein